MGTTVQVVISAKADKRSALTLISTNGYAVRIKYTSRQLHCDK